MNCIVCGSTKGHDRFNPIDDKLKHSWGINNGLAELFNIREGSSCKSCGVNIRAQGLAEAIINSKFGYGANNLKEWVNYANQKQLKICELNACHELHKILKNVEGLTYAEYGTSSQENIESLSYKDNKFDLVLHSETLEHVNNPLKALSECRRVINADGLVLFTVPVIWTKRTRVRTKIVDNKVKNLLPVSYHGKKTEDYRVFTEFGYDIGNILKCEVVLERPNVQNFVFHSNKKSRNDINKIKLLKLRLQQKYYEKVSIK